MGDDQSAVKPSQNSGWYRNRYETVIRQRQDTQQISEIKTCTSFFPIQQCLPLIFFSLLHFLRLTNVRLSGKTDLRIVGLQTRPQSEGKPCLRIHIRPSRDTGLQEPAWTVFPSILLVPVDTTAHWGQWQLVRLTADFSLF